MEHIEHIIPLHSDFSVSGFQPYVLDLSSAGLAEEEDVFTLVFVVIKRNQGLLAALPMHGLSQTKCCSQVQSPIEQTWWGLV